MSDLPPSTEPLQYTTKDQEDTEKPKGSKNRWLYAGIGIVAACCICIFMLIAGGAGVSYKQSMDATGTVEANNTQSTATKQAQYLHATAVKHEQNVAATATQLEQRARGTATTQAHYAQATTTAQTALDMVPEEIRSAFRMVRVFETFDEAGDWGVYTNDDEYYIGNAKVSEGNWVLTLDKSFKSFVQRDDVPNVSAINFYFQVDARRVMGNKSDACYGVSFRALTTGYYAFIACDDQNFSVSYLDRGKDEWVDIQNWTFSSEIRPEETNQMGVAAKGNQFDLYVNGKKIHSFTDDRTPGSGELGLLINLNTPSKRLATFEFDNVIILLP